MCPTAVSVGKENLKTDGIININLKMAMNLQSQPEIKMVTILKRKTQT